MVATIQSVQGATVLMKQVLFESIKLVMAENGRRSIDLRPLLINLVSAFNAPFPQLGRG